MLLFIGLLLIVPLLKGGTPQSQITQSQFQDKIAAGQVKTAEFREGDSVVDGQLTDGSNYEATYASTAELSLQRALTAKGVQFKVNAQRSNPILGALISVILPVALDRRRSSSTS